MMTITNADLLPSDKINKRIFKFNSLKPFSEQFNDVDIF
jgi:hypothetical protein